jgi:hypothetical protein
MLNQDDGYHRICFADRCDQGRKKCPHPEHCTAGAGWLERTGLQALGWLFLVLAAVGLALASIELGVWQ